MTALKYFTFLSFLAFVACRKTPETDPTLNPPVVVDAPKPVEWVAFQGLKTDNFSMVNLFVTPEKLLILGDNYLTEIDTAHRITRQEKFSDARLTKSWMKIHTNRVFFTYFKDETSLGVSKIAVRSVQSPQEPLEIDVTKIDTNYRFIGFSTECSAGILTSDNRLFLPVVYIPNNSNWANAQSRFLIFKLQLVGNKVKATLEPTYIPLDLTVPNMSKAYSLATLDLPKPTDKFLYFSAWATYRMEIETSRYERISDMFNARFAYRNDTLWLFGKTIPEFNLGFAFLPPRQSNWSTFKTEVSGLDINWFSVDNQLIGLHNGYNLTLFSSQLDSNKFQIRSLADNNIYARDIVSFNNRVYMATTQGLVFKPTKDFITFPKAK